jgi:class 3 adenylate cyclase
MTDRPSGTVTFLFTDIEGSTDLLQRLGDEYADVLASHFQILRAAIDGHGGTEESIDGDSLFAVFPSAVEAVGAAIDAQRQLSEYDWSEGSRVLVRMGLHSGEATYGQDGYVGLDVHRAARISTVAHGGQIVSSASTTTLAAQATPPEVSFRPLGDHRLKDLREAEQLSQVVAPGLGTEFPRSTLCPIIFRFISPTSSAGNPSSPRLAGCFLTAGW